MLDFNVSIGHWPFRHVPNTTAPELRKVLADAGITHAAVTHMHGLFYKNCHDANLELAEAIHSQAGFFTGLATLNPTYSSWERDLRACVEDLGLRGVRMAPQYHGYRLGDRVAQGMAEAAASLGIPVIIPHRLVDPRQRHWLDVEMTISPGEVIGLCSRVPQARIVYTEGSVPIPNLVDREGVPVAPNLYLEMSRMRSAYGQQLAETARAIGADHVVFGSGAPLKSITPALLKLIHADLTDHQRRWVAEKSGLGLLKGALV